MDASRDGSSNTTSAGAGERIIEGVGVAPGIAIGPAHVARRHDLDAEPDAVAPDDVEAEVERFDAALKQAEQDLERVLKVAGDRLDEASAAILEAQQMMLQDEELTAPVRRRIREKRQSAAHAVQAVMRQHRQRLAASDDAYLSERAGDLADVQHRIVSYLQRRTLAETAATQSIVVASALSAADILQLGEREVRGCITEQGGVTSHVAIIARALNVPAVAGAEAVTTIVSAADTVVLDGLRGQVVVRPTPDTLRAYRERQEQYRAFVRRESRRAPLAGKTRDGRRLRLRANVQVRDELGALAQYGAEGIGLVRTELLFLGRQEVMQAEDEQYAAYREIVEEAAPHPVTIRLFDLGGDKSGALPAPTGAEGEERAAGADVHEANAGEGAQHGERPAGRWTSPETNPALGWRGVRVLLDRPDLLRTQLRALVRASAHGSLRILIPMVTTVDEVRRVREALHAVQADLAADDVPTAETIPLGIMVEVPAVALQAGQFARTADFLSVGTNDLAQYVLAVDRANSAVADRFDALHPAVLELVARTAERGRLAGVPVSLCGEVAGDPEAVPLLLGAGLTALSASPARLPTIRHVVRALRYEEAAALTGHALKADDGGAVRALVREWAADHLPGGFHPEDASPPDNNGTGA
jgi:phosphotransferase system enzyme I (PtsI)